MVHDGVTRSIEARCEGDLGDGHADGVGQALPQGTGGSLDAGGLAVFRMAWGTAPPLAEPLEFLQWQVEARDMKQSVQERTPMSGRENKAVPVGPEGITRVELEQAIPERVGHGRRTQGRPGCPDLALCTASTARKRRVLTQSSSSSGGAMVVESVMLAMNLLGW